MNKKILSLLLTFILVFTSLIFSIPITKSNADDVYYGDVDKDGQVTILDATLIQRYCAGIASLTLDQKRRADVDFNGQNMELMNAVKLYVIDYLRFISGKRRDITIPVAGDINHGSGSI